jgi:hypothetical protein
MFFKGTPSEKKYSQANFRGIHSFFFIPIGKVLFSNLLSKKGMSYVTYPVRERVKYLKMETWTKLLKICSCRGKKLRLSRRIVFCLARIRNL